MNRRSLLDLGLATALVASGAAWATTSTSAKPDAGQVVKVCVGKRDAVVSAKANGRCPKGSRVMKINAAGVTGATGTTGAVGATGERGTDGASGKDGSPAPAPVVTLRGVTAAAIGDSNTNRNGPWGHVWQNYTPQLAWFHQAATRVGQRVRMTNNFAVPGTRSDEMLAQQVPQVLALSPQPSVVTVMAGTNDISQGRTAAQVIASLDATYDAMAEPGIKVIAGTVLPSLRWDTPEKLATVAEVNAWIMARVGVEVVDFHALLADETGAPKPGVLMDGTHISPRGAALMGAELAPLLEQMFPAVDVFPSPGANLVPAGSVNVRADGVDVGVLDGFTPGDRVVALVEFETDQGADATVRQIEATVVAGGTSNTAGAFTDTPAYDGPEAVLGSVPRSGVLMTPPMRVPAGTDGLSLSVRVSGGAESFRVGRVALVLVP